MTWHPKIVPMFFNPDVSVEEEIAQATAWKLAQMESEKRARKLVNEWKMEMRPVKKENEVTPEMIERARTTPIENLINIGRAGICCLWHDEKTASMKLTKRNKLRCYGACGKSFDSIDVYRQIHGVSFHEAVRSLQ